MTPDALLPLAARCAPEVAPATLMALVTAESARQPFTIGLNGPEARSLRFSTLKEAVAQAQRLAAQCRDFDLGLTQINVRNLPALQLSLATAFDPCRNLSAGARILVRAYRAQPDVVAQRGARLDAALSVYNTGDPQRGLRNGYVARVYRAAGYINPTIWGRGRADDAADAPKSPAIRLKPHRADDGPPEPDRRVLDPFARSRASFSVWRSSGRPQLAPAAFPLVLPAPGSRS